MHYITQYILYKFCACVCTSTNKQVLLIQIFESLITHQSCMHFLYSLFHTIYFYFWFSKCLYLPPLAGITLFFRKFARHNWFTANRCTSRQTALHLRRGQNVAEPRQCCCCNASVTKQHLSIKHCFPSSIHLRCLAMLGKFSMNNI